MPSRLSQTRHTPLADCANFIANERRVTTPEEGPEQGEGTSDTEPRPSPEVEDRRTSGRTRRPSKKAKQFSGAAAMPSAITVKRVKGKSIARSFIIGSEAWPLEESEKKKYGIPAQHTKRWRIYVKVADGQPDMTRWLKKVQFKIHSDYKPSSRGVESPPFQIEETGWGGFETEVRLFFHNDFFTKPETRTHFLQLLPYGDEAQQKKQNEENMVRSEFFDIIEFNEPTETCWNALTDPDQWSSPKKGRGKGKGKNIGGLRMEEVGEGTVALPEVGSIGNIYSLELEQQNVDKLRKAEAEIEKLIAEEIRRGREVHERLMELRRG